MNFKASQRLNLGVILVVLFSLTSQVRLVGENFVFSKPIGRDNISSYEKRFLELKKLLPSYGLIGYITEPKVVNAQDLKLAQTVDAAEFYLTQYTLSPVILSNSLKQGLVVGNFHSGIKDNSFLKDKKLILIQDFGNGVMLFKRDIK